MSWQTRAAAVTPSRCWAQFMFRWKIKQKKKLWIYKRACDIVKYKGDVALNTRAVSLHLSTWRLAGEYEESREREISWQMAFTSLPGPMNITYTMTVRGPSSSLFFPIYKYTCTQPASNRGQKMYNRNKESKDIKREKGKQHFDRFLFFFF